MYHTLDLFALRLLYPIVLKRGPDYKIAPRFLYTEYIDSVGLYTSVDVLSAFIYYLDLMDIRNNSPLQNNLTALLEENKKTSTRFRSCCGSWQSSTV